MRVLLPSRVDDGDGGALLREGFTHVWVFYWLEGGK